MSYQSEKEVRTHVELRGLNESFIEGEGNCEPQLVETEIDDGAALDHAESSHELISSLIRGVIHGKVTGSREEDEQTVTAKKLSLLSRLLDEVNNELYPGCKEVTKISFIVMLFQIKCMDGISNSSLERILWLFFLVLPDGHCLPTSLEKVERVIRDLGLHYKKIHACVNDCVLFRGHYAELDKCPTCDESRWKEIGVLKRMILLTVIVERSRSIFHVRSFVIFHLFLGCKDCL
jgi:hypothetical protein